MSLALLAFASFLHVTGAISDGSVGGKLCGREHDGSDESSFLQVAGTVRLGGTRSHGDLEKTKTTKAAPVRQTNSAKQDRTLERHNASFPDISKVLSGIGGKVSHIMNRWVPSYSATRPGKQVQNELDAIGGTISNITDSWAGRKAELLHKKIWNKPLFNWSTWQDNQIPALLKKIDKRVVETIEKTAPQLADIHYTPTFQNETGPQVTPKMIDIPPGKTTPQTAENTTKIAAEGKAAKQAQAAKLLAETVLQQPARTETAEMLAKAVLRKSNGTDAQDTKEAARLLAETVLRQHAGVA